MKNFILIIIMAVIAAANVQAEKNEVAQVVNCKTKCIAIR